MMTTLPVVVVVWHDSWFDFSLPDAAAARDDYIVLTVGYLIAETPTRISVAQEVLPEDDGYRAVTHIRRCDIETVTPLQELVEELRDAQ